MRASPGTSTLHISMAVWNLVQVYARVGEPELALDQLEYLLTIPVPSRLSAGLLRFRPALDPLRDHPRFQKLLDEAMRILPPPPS